MGDADHQRFLSWLSRLDEAEPVIPQEDSQPSARFIFEGISAANQTLDAATNPKRSLCARRQRTLLELENFEQPRLPSRPTTKGTDTRLSRKEQNGYERIPRAKTKEDRYEYKGKNSRVDSNRGTIVKNKKTPKQKRKHTINEDFRASNVPSNRLTLYPPTNVGIFNKGKRSSPVRTRVLDQSFSETDFLSKPPLYKQVNREVRHGTKNMFAYDFGTGDTNDNQNEAGVERTRPNFAATQQQAQGGNIELNIDGTSIYHEGENDAASKGNSVCDPLSQPTPGIKTKTSPRRPIGRSSSNQSMQSVAHEPTMHLLDFDLHSPNDGLAPNNVKKLWTLEDLKRILKRRVAAWSAKDDESIATSSQFQQRSRKRKRSPSQEPQDPHAEVANKARHIMDTRPINKSTTPRTAILGSSSILGGFVDQPLGQPVPMSRHIDYFGERSILEHQHHCREEGPSQHYGENTYLTSQAFDAAYEAIMRSELDTPSHLLEHQPMIDSSVGNNEGYVNFLSSAPLEWGSRGEETLDPSLPGQGIVHLHRESWPFLDTAETRHYDPQPSIPIDSFGNRAPLLSVEPSPAWELGSARNRNYPASDTLALDVDLLTNFWQQNKLY